MAFVPSTAQTMTVTFEDRDKNTSNVAFYVPSAVVAADAATFITTDLPPILTGLSDAFVRRVALSRTYENDTYVQPPETSDVERKGVFSWIASDRSRSKTEIPSIKNTLVIDGTSAIYQADAAVVAFVGMMVDAGLLDVYGLGNYRGVKITALQNTPHKMHRKSSKG